MMTEETRIEITAIVRAELSDIAVLPVHMIAEKAQKIYDKVHDIYMKLEEKKLIPEGMNLDIFHHLYLHRLQQAAAAAHVSGMGFFI